MGNFFNGVFEIFFLIGYFLLFVVTILILRPFRYHRRRLKSTILLKMSYLLYLLSFLIFTYLLLFGHREVSESEQRYDSLFNIHFLLFLTSTIVPNLGIMIRRKISKNRVDFNILVSIVNLIYFFYLIYLCVTHKWALM
jgi:hypothetical protein